MELTELRDRLVASRGKKAHHQEITKEDILMATKKLKCFGDGFSVISMGKGRYMVQSVPGELSLQETSILTLASDRGDGCVSMKILMDSLNWTEFRAKQALDKIVGDGLAWVDLQSEEPTYWFPSLFAGRKI